VPQLRERSFLAYIAVAAIGILVLFIGQLTIIHFVSAISLGIVFGISIGYLSAKKELRQIEEGKMKMASTIALLLITGASIVVSVGLTVVAPYWYYLPKEVWSSILLLLATCAPAANEVRIYLFNTWERIHQREILVDETGLSRKVYASPPPILQQDN
jgi:hypothetical protein